MCSSESIMKHLNKHVTEIMAMSEVCFVFVFVAKGMYLSAELTAECLRDA